MLFSKYIGAHVEMKEFDGEYIEHICIPLKPNGLRRTKGNHIVGSFSINKKKRVDIYNNSSYVSVYTNKSVMSNAKKLNRENDLRFIGSVYETKDPHNIFAKVLNMEDDLKEIKALDTMYKKIGENEQNEEE